MFEIDSRALSTCAQICVHIFVIINAKCNIETKITKKLYIAVCTHMLRACYTHFYLFMTNGAVRLLLLYCLRRH